MSRQKKAPSVYKIGGVALSVPRWLARGVWYATGIAPAGTARPTVAPVVVVDPLASEQARDLRAVFAKCDVDATLIGAVVGPKITRYRVKLGAATKAEKVEKCATEIRLAMGTDKISILVPIPGEKGVVGIEIPRADPELVPFAPLLASVADPHPLIVALGRAMDGTPVTPNLAEMPHILVAGQTGGGKSACLHTFLVSLITRATPEQVELLLIDPKKVEFTAYATVPHLICSIITDARRASSALEDVCADMDRRYDRLAAAGCRNIDEYNGKNPGTPMKYRVVIVDEFGDLMVIAKEAVEESIQRITQLARAAGIHLVLATQRPSVDVITGVIKANLPSRLAFSVATGTDSRVILDANGAECLLGKGDALFSASGSTPDRVQGAWVTDEEISAAVAGAGIVEHREPVEPGVEIGDDEDTRRAIAAVLRERRASTSFLQTELRLGHPKAKALMVILEQRGIIGPQDGNKAREILVAPSE